MLLQLHISVLISNWGTVSRAEAVIYDIVYKTPSLQIRSLKTLSMSCGQSRRYKNDNEVSC